MSATLFLRPMLVHHRLLSACGIHVRVDQSEMTWKFNLIRVMLGDFHLVFGPWVTRKFSRSTPVKILAHADKSAAHVERVSKIDYMGGTLKTLDPLGLAFFVKVKITPRHARDAHWFHFNQSGSK